MTSFFKKETLTVIQRFFGHTDNYTSNFLGETVAYQVTMIKC